MAKRSRFAKGYDWYTFFVALWSVVTTWVDPKDKTKEVVGGKNPLLSVIVNAIWNNPDCWVAAFRGRRGQVVKRVDGLIARDSAGNMITEEGWKGGACNNKLSKLVKSQIRSRWVNFFAEKHAIAEKVAEHEEFLESGEVQVVIDGKPQTEPVEFEEEYYNVDTKQHMKRKATKDMPLMRPVEETDREYRERLEELVEGKIILRDFPGILAVDYKEFPDVVRAREKKQRKRLSPEAEAALARNRAMSKRNAAARIQMAKGQMPFDNEIDLADAETEIEDHGYSIADLRKAAGLEPLPAPTAPAAPVTEAAQQTSEEVLQAKD